MYKLLLTVLALAGASQGYAQCLRGEKAFSPEPVIRSIGDRELDSDLVSQSHRLNSSFDVSSSMRFFDDSNSPNGYATGERVVHAGQMLMINELNDRDKGPAAVMGILAHEWGHIIQMSKGDALPGPVAELHEDFLAGYYLARQKQTREFALKGFTSSLYAKVDHDQHRRPYGTPPQRIEALLAGFKAHGLDLDLAYSRGLRLANRLAP